MCGEEVRDCGKVGYVALGLPVEERIVNKSHCRFRYLQGCVEETGDACQIL